MSDTAPKTAFLAVLIYEDGPSRRCEEPRVYTATHPEIAYQLALADGDEQRFGRRFKGLSRLEETTEDVAPIARSQAGNASELVVNKDELAAFSDPRWNGIPCDETELAMALRGAPLLFEIEGLNSMPKWRRMRLRASWGCAAPCLLTAALFKSCARTAIRILPRLRRPS